MTSLTFLICRSRYFEPASVQLYTSRGYETPSHKLFMRTAVVVTDVLIYFTAVYLFVYHSYFKDSPLLRKVRPPLICHQYINDEMV
jgi:hypothetical protein